MSAGAIVFVAGQAYLTAQSWAAPPVSGWLVSQTGVILIGWMCRLLFIVRNWLTHGTKRTQRPSMFVDTPDVVLLTFHLVVALYCDRPDPAQWTFLWQVAAHGFVVALAASLRGDRPVTPWGLIGPHVACAALIGIVAPDPNLRLGVARIYDQRDPVVSLLVTVVAVVAGSVAGKIVHFAAACTTALRMAHNG